MAQLAFSSSENSSSDGFGGAKVPVVASNAHLTLPLYKQRNSQLDIFIKMFL